MNTDDLKQYVEEHFDETIELLRTLGQIAAPSHMEDRRAKFCRDWLQKQGAQDVWIDEAKNVICRIQGQEAADAGAVAAASNAATAETGMTVIMAHTDVVFPDTDTLPLREADGKLFAPGIGDDTANLVNLMMSVKFLLEKGLKPQKAIMFVANSCEEGLGNLKGSRQIYQDYGEQIEEWISYDGYMGHLTEVAVGSHRYRVTVKTTGGHSYMDFGRDNAIAILADMIHDLYQIRVPEKEKTTYNVGVIEGGTTVNSIAQEAGMLYEFRSSSQACLEEMEEKFRAVLETYRKKGFHVELEVLGIRPGSGPIDRAKLKALTDANMAVMESCMDGQKGKLVPSSTDANIPLSVGIPANTFGTVLGGLAHTREEWIDIESMRPGLLIALKTAARYC